MAFDRVGRLRPTWTLAVHHQYDLCSERQVEVALPLTRLTWYACVLSAYRCRSSSLTRSHAQLRVDVHRDRTESHRDFSDSGELVRNEN